VAVLGHDEDATRFCRGGAFGHLRARLSRATAPAR
jgi:hypothetical protein